jgi:cobalamin biosynthesis protein CobD/CbiB
LTGGGSVILPWWLSVPLSGMVMAMLIWHVMALQKPGIPASRRRIRTTTGVLMLLLTPLIAFALSVATPDRPRVMTLAWSGVLLLVGLVMVLAWVDVINNLRLYQREKRELRAEAARALAADAAERDPRRPAP